MGKTMINIPHIVNSKRGKFGFFQFDYLFTYDEGKESILRTMNNKYSMEFVLVSVRRCLNRDVL